MDSPSREKFTPIDIDLVWPQISPVARSTLDGGIYTADEILIECREGRAVCFTCTDGFVIAKLVPCRSSEDFELLVLLAMAVGPHGAFERALPDVTQMAKDLDAKRIVFHTPRRGWEKKLGPEWKMRDMTFVRQVT